MLIDFFASNKLGTLAIFSFALTSTVISIITPTSAKDNKKNLEKMTILYISLFL